MELEYKLCTDDKFSDSAFAGLFAHHGVASKYFFHLYFDLTKSGGEYTLREAIPFFLGSDDVSREILAKTAGLPANTADLGTKVLVHIVKKYPRQYAMFPAVVDCNIDRGFVHQCMIIISDGVFIFYEPYGTYTKYDARYDITMKKYAESLAGHGLDVSFDTWHNKFGSLGVQTHILNTNNKRAAEFRDQFAAIYKEMEQLGEKWSKMAVLRISALDKDSPLSATDETLHSLDYLQIVNYALNTYGETSPLLGRLYELYGRYGSKTCVSITLVEMDCLARGSPAELAKKIEAGDPNIVLMNELERVFGSITLVEPPYDLKNKL